MFSEIVSDIPTPSYLRMGNDRHNLFDVWALLLEALSIDPIKSIPLTPDSHPFVEQKTGSVRRKHLDQLFYWNSRDFEQKLDELLEYFSEHRVHLGTNGTLPNWRVDESKPKIASLENYSWESYCNSLSRYRKPHKKQFATHRLWLPLA